MASKDGSSASGKLDASAPTFSPSVVQLTQRRSVADGQSQGATAPRGCTGGSTEVRFRVD